MKKKVTPRTNKRKVVCSVCGANINSDNKIIHSRRRHPFLRKYLAENICTDAFLPELHSSGVLYDARTLESYSNIQKHSSNKLQFGKVFFQLKTDKDIIKEYHRPGHIAKCCFD